MSIQISGFIVRAQQRYKLPLAEGEQIPRVRNVSARFSIREAAEEFVALYVKAHPDQKAWVDDLQTDDGLP